jgi:hypothetical protein
MQLSGLWTSEDELRSVFKGLEDKLLIRRSNNVAFVYLKDDGPCPFWKEGCRIYANRPLDCRLFPYKMTNIIQIGNRIKITFNNLADCPKRDVLMTEADAAMLVVEFGKMVYGQDANIVAQNERTVVLRTLNVLESYLSCPRLVVGGE